MLFSPTPDIRARSVQSGAARAAQPLRRLDAMIGPDKTGGATGQNGTEQGDVAFALSHPLWTDLDCEIMMILRRYIYRYLRPRVVERVFRSKDKQTF